METMGSSLKHRNHSHDHRTIRYNIRVISLNVFHTQERIPCKLNVMQTNQRKMLYENDVQILTCALSPKNICIIMNPPSWLNILVLP